MHLLTLAKLPAQPKTAGIEPAGLPRIARPAATIRAPGRTNIPYEAAHIIGKTG